MHYQQLEDLHIKKKQLEDLVHQLLTSPPLYWSCTMLKCYIELIFKNL